MTPPNNLVRQKAKTAGEAFSLEGSVVYQYFLEEREEILRHKWLESERAGHDIGFERALLDWVLHYRDDWRRSRRRS